MILKIINTIKTLKTNMDSVDKMIGTFISFGIIICILKIQNGEKKLQILSYRVFNLPTV